MKKYSRILTLLLALVMITACLPVYAEEPEEIRYVSLSDVKHGDIVLMDGEPYYLTPELDTAIAAGITTGFSSWDGENFWEVDIAAYDVSAEDADDLSQIFMYMHPELWYGSIVGYGIDINSKVMYLNVDYETADKKNAYEAAVTDILSQIDPSLSEFGKVLWIHEYLCLNCEYDYENYLADTVPIDSYTPYGALVSKICVCQGYTLAYMDLLARLGIESIAVQSDDMNHVWLAVLLDGEWYHIDATWDDPVGDGVNGYPGEVSHDWFLRCDDWFFNEYDMSTVDWNDPNTYPPDDILYSWVHYNYTFMFESAAQAALPLADTSYGSPGDDAFWDSRYLPIYPLLDGEANEYYYYLNVYPWPGTIGIYKREKDSGTSTLELDMSSYRWPDAADPAHSYWNGLSGFQYYDGQLYVNTPTQIMSYDYLEPDPEQRVKVFAEPEL